MEFLKKKKIVRSESWEDLKKGEHSHAFTVAHSMKADILEDIFEALNESLEAGETCQMFKARIWDTLIEKGWYGGREDKEGDEGYLNWRLNVIFRVNMMTAYSAGRTRQMISNGERGLRTIWVYSAIMDKRTRDSHKKLHLKAFKWDHSFWDEYDPPNGWYCRCSKYSITESTAKRRGIEILDETPDYVQSNKFCPDEWKYSPGKQEWKPKWDDYEYLNKYKTDNNKSVLDEIKADWEKSREKYA